MNKKTLAIVIAINMILVGLVTTLYFTLWKPAGKEGYLIIIGASDSELILNINDLESLPAISRSYYLQGTPSFEANYTGVSVYYLLTEFANLTNENTQIKVKAIDNYSYSLTLHEFNNTRDIIIAYLKNGDYLKSAKNGGEGPLRLIIPQRFPREYNGQYCVKYVTTLEILPTEQTIWK